MRKLLKKKAFTLVEVIIAMAIMTILIVAAMSMFNPVNGIVKSLDEDTVTNAVTDTITNYVTDKLKNASTYSIKGYKTEDLTKNSDVDSSVAKIASVMFADKELDETVYCMILRTTAEGYQLYDLGKLNGVVDYKTKATSLVNNNAYAVFNNEYYNDSRYKFTFKTTSGDKGTWCRMGVNTYDSDGNIKVSERVQMFKLLNMSLLKLTPSSSTDLENYSYSDDMNIVILYRIKVFG